MPRRNDIEKVLIIGSGPTVIGQGSEFDYFINEALKAFKELDIETVLVNSNPSSVSTDMGKADVTYIEPLNVKSLAAIIAYENPTAILPTFGGQRALNLCSELSKAGILERYDVKTIGAQTDAIELTENRIAFKKLMVENGLTMVRSASASNADEAESIANYLNYPVVIRPAFTTGGFGGGLVYNVEELRDVANRGIAASIARNVLIEEAVLGFKELEAEVLRDSTGKVVIAGMLENIDPMGVHTGDSVSVLPVQTLPNAVIERMKADIKKITAALNIIGSVNIQFAYNPITDQLIVVEVNLRLSRTSALISKATELSIAKIAAKLSMGVNFNEIMRDGTQHTMERYSFQPDYITVKLPCWSMEKFRGSVDKLGTQMKSVGEVMAIGANFKEAFHKAFRSLENGKFGLNIHSELSLEELYSRLRSPSSERYYNIYEALLKGGSVDYVNELTGIDKYFIKEINDLALMEKELHAAKSPFSPTPANVLLVRQVKRLGFSDRYIASLKAVTEREVREFRINNGILPSFFAVPGSDTFYSSYKSNTVVTAIPANKPILISGCGPTRIGQGSEFDYSSVHAADAVIKCGYTPVTINCNPAAISTDCSAGARVYIEPITLEDVLAVSAAEKTDKIMTAFGGHNSYSLTPQFAEAGLKILGADSEAISITENRDRFKALLSSMGINMTSAGVASDNDEAQKIASKTGYPIIVRPPYVMGGRGMEIIHESEGLRRYMLRSAAGEKITIEKFLTDASELEVDAIAAGGEVFIPEYTQHIEYAGIHSGDSDCLIPSANRMEMKDIAECTAKVAGALKVKGLINIKYALMNGVLYMLEARIRSSRSVPLISKVININLSSIAAEILLTDDKAAAAKVRELKVVKPAYYGVKAAIFPFEMFREVDPILGPEMRSTGSVLGLGKSIGEAYFKAQEATDVPMPMSGTVMISVDDSKKKDLESIACDFIKLGFNIIATSGTFNYLKSRNVSVKKIDKMYEGRPNIVDAMINGKVDLLINTPSGIKSEYDDSFIRKVAIKHRICYITTIEAANAIINGIKELRSGKYVVKSLQSYYMLRRS